MDSENFQLITEDDGQDRRSAGTQLRDTAARSRIPQFLRTRRAFLGAAAAAAAGLGVAGWRFSTAPLGSSRTRPYLVVFLFTALQEPVVQSNINTARQALAALGYTEGENVTYQGRSAERVPERFPQLAEEIVALKPDVVVCQNPQAASALQKATRTIPIVFAAIGVDPLEAGLVASLSRPGGNMTGIMGTSSGIYSKRLQLLKEAVPTIRAVAVIRDPNEPPQGVIEMQRLAPSLGVQVITVDVPTPRDLDANLARAAAAGADALIHTGTANFVLGNVDAARIGKFALDHRWPTMLGYAAGGLMDYGGANADAWHRVATYIDRILRGTSPGDLPIEGPTSWMFMVNMCTAAKLGVVFPASILSRATDIRQCAPA
jgi:putative ABC transport system substrate-binding protein